MNPRSPAGTDPVALVVLTRNSLRFLPALFEGLRETPGWSRVIVADSASTDGTPEYVEGLEGIDARVVRNPVNVSPGRATNQAFALLREHETVVKLDSDVVPLPGWLERLRVAAEGPDVGVVGARLLFGDGSVQHAGGLLHSPGDEWVVDLLTEDAPSRDVPWVSGACMLIGPELRAQVPRFDDRYPFWFEDVDYCFAARKAGFRVRYSREAALHHFEESQRTPRPEVWDSHRMFVEKWGGEKPLWRLGGRPAREEAAHG